MRFIGPGYATVMSRNNKKNHQKLISIDLVLLYRSPASLNIFIKKINLHFFSITECKINSKRISGPQFLNLIYWLTWIVLKFACPLSLQDNHVAKSKSGFLIDIHSIMLFHIKHISLHSCWSMYNLFPLYLSTINGNNRQILVPFNNLID